MAKKATTTIRSVAEMCLKNGMSYEDSLAAVKRVFPSCKTTMKCMYYYGHHLGLGKKAKQEVNDAELKKLEKAFTPKREKKAA